MRRCRRSTSPATNSTASGTTPYRPTNNHPEALIYPQALSPTRVIPPLFASLLCSSWHSAMAIPSPLGVSVSFVLSCLRSHDWSSDREAVHFGHPGVGEHARLTPAPRRNGPPFRAEQPRIVTKRRKVEAYVDGPPCQLPIYVDGPPCQLPIEASPALRSNVGPCIAA